MIITRVTDSKFDWVLSHTWQKNHLFQFPSVSVFSQFLNLFVLRTQFSIFMLCCLAMPIVGTYGWLNGRIHAAKYAASVKIKKSIPSADQLLWKFSKADAALKLDWEHSREFEYKGEMYDVIRSKEIGDTIWYWCYWDRKETKLKRQRNLIVFNLLGPSPLERDQRSTITQFFRSLYYTPLPVSSGQTALINVRRCIAPYQPLQSEYHSELHPPPPWLT